LPRRFSKGRISLGEFRTKFDNARFDPGLPDRHFYGRQLGLRVGSALKDEKQNTIPCHYEFDNSVLLAGYDEAGFLNVESRELAASRSQSGMSRVQFGSELLVLK